MQTELSVTGMSCSHCESSVKKAVAAIGGVEDVSVDLAGKTVTVTHDESVALAIIKAQIEEQGFEVT